jgi:hypothetical protein
MFMDRIYTAHDSDLNLFKEFATKSNFGLKQSKIWKLILRLQTETKKLELTVSLDTDFYRYPYCDTIAYLNKSNNISNSDDDYELELKTPMVVQWVMKMMGIMTVMMKTIQMKIIK